MASVMSAARTLGDLSGWSLSNLEMQKTLYFAQMLHLGRGNGPLFDDEFEAWDYGPVVNRLYHAAKPFGAKPVGRIFFDPAFQEAGSRYLAVEEAYQSMRHLTPGQMVSLTHWENGAWSKYYHPKIRRRPIPNAAIKQEYEDRLALVPA